MNKALAPFYLLRLCLVASPTLLQLGWLSLRLYQTVLSSLVVACLAILITASLNFRASPTLLEVGQKLLISIPTASPPIITTQSKGELEAELAKWLKIYEQQPSHRDALINLSLLYRALGDTAAAGTYFEQARQLDPNHSLLK